MGLVWLYHDGEISTSVMFAIVKEHGGIAGVAVEALIENTLSAIPESCRHILRGLIVLAQIIHPQNLNVAVAAYSEEVLTKRSPSATCLHSVYRCLFEACIRSYCVCQQAASRSPPPIRRRAVVTWKPKEVRHLRLLTSPCGVTYFLSCLINSNRNGRHRGPRSGPT
jgi:hypothetical protein